MKKILLAVCLAVICLVSVQFYSLTTAPSQQQPSITTDRFPDYGFLDTATYRAKFKSPEFKLSQDFPKTLPIGPKPVFFQTDFKKDWKKYMLQVRDYCFEGNTEVDFRVENNKVRKWYHMPWQHWDVSGQGREGIHGLTKEAPINALQLGPAQTIDSAGAWAVGFYNDIGGYTIGQVWKDHYNPDASVTTGPKGGFKPGAVLFKLLFASVPQNLVTTQVPYLANGQWWDAYVSTKFKSKTRVFTKVVLIQMDIMIRDERAPSKWLAGTFQYNGQMNKANKWENMVPVGLMWGEDPQQTASTYTNATPTVTKINPDLRETVINPDPAELPVSHLGWNGRLNGPVDNPQSSCFSCHATAQYPQASPISPLFSEATRNFPPGSEKWMIWFQNYQCASIFPGINDPQKLSDVKSTDFSLQLADALQNFDTWKSTQEGMFAQTRVDPKPQSMPMFTVQSGKPQFKSRTVYEIRRNF